MSFRKTSRTRISFRRDWCKSVPANFNRLDENGTTGPKDFPIDFPQIRWEASEPYFHLLYRLHENMRSVRKWSGISNKFLQHIFGHNSWSKHRIFMKLEHRLFDAQFHIHMSFRTRGRIFTSRNSPWAAFSPSSPMLHWFSNLVVMCYSGSVT